MGDWFQIILDRIHRQCGISVVSDAAHNCPGYISLPLDLRLLVGLHVVPATEMEIPNRIKFNEYSHLSGKNKIKVV